VVFFKAFDVAGNSVFSHFPGLAEGSPIRDAAGQCGNDRSEAAFRFWAQDNVETDACFFHIATEDAIRATTDESITAMSVPEHDSEVHRCQQRWTG